MIRMPRAALLAALPMWLGGCLAATDAPPAAPDLESVAIERGVVVDPGRAVLSGLYARGSDRLCAVDAAKGAVRIGVFVDYGDGIGCAGRGSARQSGEKVAIDLGSGCSFTARFDGERIAFPGDLPESCDRLCRGSASLAGLSVSRLSDARSEAVALRSPRGIALCEGS